MSFIKEKLAKKFAEEYANLNEEQRLAVDTIEGPVMVIAGPGTGKTQILASRIGKILLETDTLPQNILCLTYTEAGVVAMRKRLLNFIGGDAYKVAIHTFHSFCNTAIQENISHFNKKELEALSDLERVQCVKQLIDGFDKNNPLKRYKGDIYYDLNNLVSLFSAIKREGWDTDHLITQIDDYINNTIPVTDGFYNKNEYKKGILKLTQKGNDEVGRMEKLKAAIHSFAGYQQILHDQHRYDFDDMINWVIDMFQQKPETLLNYQEQFQYILVDEYQDTSGSQNKIIELLISYWQDESPNIFVVGDDDQSIYRFQGANLKNMMNLADAYEKDLVKVVLTKNYRSVQPILDGATGLIAHNEQRLVNQYKDLSKELVASKPELKTLTIFPEIRVYENEFAENVHITASIRDLIDRGVHPGKIAVIYREHKYGDEMLHFFQLQNIPFYVKRSINLLEDVFIKQVINFIRYTVSELETPFSGEYLLFEIMHYEFFKIEPFKIAVICNEIAASTSKKEEATTLRGYLQNLQSSNGTTLFADDAQQDALLKLGKLLETLQTAIHNKSIQQWFEYLINESGIISWIMHQPDKSWQMSKLTCLFDYIKESTHRQPNMSLKTLMQQLDLLTENKLSLPLVQTTGTDTGVNLLTCHGSKGLEYEYVFLLGARNDVWEGKKNPNRGFRLPHTVMEQVDEAEAEEELRRLFYVAVTRAEKHLYISYPQMKNDGKPVEPSQFMEEFKQALQLESNLIRLTEEEKLNYAALRFGVVKKPVLEEQEKEFVNRQLEKFVMSVTALNSYLDCPLRFYYNSIIRVPSAKNEAATFGTTVHDALNDFFNHMMNNGKVYPGKDFLIQRFRFHINSNREVFSRESLPRFIEHGESVLEKYYDHYYVPAPKNEFIMSEYPFRKVMVDNIPLRGFADKIQFWGNDIVITDFKTGSYSKSKTRGEFDLPGSSRMPDGGNYWRQAVFYNILIENLPGKNWKVLHTQFDFVEPNDKEEYDVVKLNVTPDDESEVKAQIKRVWEQIQQHNFYTGCGHEDCEWCNFVKDNKIYASLIEEESEESAIEGEA